MALEFSISDQSVGSPPGTPQAIRRLRRQNYDWARYIGEPVVVMHRFNAEDLDAGHAKQCPACFDAVYGQVRKDCLICFGVGFVSIADDPQFWIDVNGHDVSTDSASGIRAPLFGGFDKPYVTFLVEPDTPTDIFKIDQAGGLVRTKQAQGFAPWTPTLYDNDLCINITLDGAKEVAATGDRFLLKMVEPVTIRGFGRQQNFQEYLVAQQFEMARVVNEGTATLYRVPHNGRRLFIDPSTTTGVTGVAFVSATTRNGTTDRHTVTGHAVLSASDVRQYDEGNFVNSVAVVSAIDLHIFTGEAATITSVASILTTDTDAMVDAATETGRSVIFAGDIANGTEINTATVIGVGVETAADLAAYLDAAIGTSVSAISATVVNSFVNEVSTETSVAVPTATDVAAYIDANTSNGVSQPGSSDHADWNPDAGTVIGATFLLGQAETIDAPATVTGVASVFASGLPPGP